MLTPDDLLSIEENAVANVAGQWRVNVETLKKDIQLALATASKEELPAVIKQIEAMLNNLVIVQGMDAQALQAVEEAHQFGLKMFTQATGDAPVPIPVSNNSKKAVTGLDEGAVKAVTTALGNLKKTVKTKTDVITALSPVLTHPNKVEQSTAWAVNNSSNSALSKLAKKTGERLTWISERNACVHCIAYSGKHADANGFPKGLTFGAKPLTVPGNTLPHPPLHPRCRCSVEIGITDEYAEALERESVRSVLRGFKTDSESEKIRIEAAERLLAQNPEAPASVKKYSRQKIKQYTKKKEAKQNAKARTKD